MSLTARSKATDHPLTACTTNYLIYEITSGDFFGSTGGMPDGNLGKAI